MWEKLSQNDELMKLVFDHLRNLGICAALLVASGWRFKNAGDGHYFWIDVVAAALVGAIAVALFFANTAHLGRHLLQMGLSPRWCALPGALFAALVTPQLPHLLTAFR